MAPLHCTSGGKLFLCDCTPEEVSAYIARTDLKPRTSHSITSPEKLILELNRVKELGWAEDREELELGIQCIGAAIRDKDGRVVAALTIVSSSDMQHKPDWVVHLKNAVNSISRKIAADAGSGEITRELREMPAPRGARGAALGTAAGREPLSAAGANTKSIDRAAS